MSLLNPELDFAALSKDWAVDDRLRIKDILVPTRAAQLQKTLTTDVEFNLVMARQGKMAAVSPAQLQQLSQADQQLLQRDLMADARQGIGYLYHGLHLDKTTNPLLQQFLTDINSEETLAKIRQLTGITDITHADGQATQFLPGHYLTRHSDSITGETRRMAYVVNLTPNWHPDWGGLLQFYEEDGTPRDAWAPDMNVLSLFNVRHIHGVSHIAPFAGAPRHAITGWFRA